MKKVILGTAGVLIASAALFAACGGGGGGTSSNQPVGPTVSRGVITGFGSVFVNGVEFDTSSASVTIDDSSSAESDLRIGMEVTVRSDGTSASSITAADDLEGPISSIDAAGQSFAVLGQTVQTDTLTRFENIAGFTALGAGNIVEVNGPVDSAGIIHATRVELKTASPSSGREIEVKGTIAGLDSSTETFTLGALTVDYSNAALEDFPAGGIADGQYVEVKSTVGQTAGGSLAATRVQLEHGLEASENEHVEVEGFITDYASNGSFKVDGMTVDASGLTISGLANDVMVEVEGTMNADGVLVAGRVELEDSSDSSGDDSPDGAGHQ